MEFKVLDQRSDIFYIVSNFSLNGKIEVFLQRLTKIVWSEFAAITAQIIYE